MGISAGCIIMALSTPVTKLKERSKLSACPQYIAGNTNHFLPYVMLTVVRVQ